MADDTKKREKKIRKAPQKEKNVMILRVPYNDCMRAFYKLHLCSSLFLSCSASIFCFKNSKSDPPTSPEGKGVNCQRSFTVCKREKRRKYCRQDAYIVHFIACWQQISSRSVPSSSPLHCGLAQHFLVPLILANQGFKLVWGTKTRRSSIIIYLGYHNGTKAGT